MYRKFHDAPAGLRLHEKTDTWQECQKNCAKIEQCKGFTWHNENSFYAKSCALFSTHSGKITGAKTVSGLKECPKDKDKMQELDALLQGFSPIKP